MPLQFYNSLTRQVDKFQPVESGSVKLYTCGPTVYDYAHIGNFRAYIFEDLLRRTLCFCGYDVTQVMNLTDVDDKTIRNANQAGVPLNEYTAKYKKAFFDDLATLRIAPAEHYPAATDHIQDMIKLIQKLLDKGYAYIADDKSVYFSIAKFKNYGQLVNIDPAKMKSTERVSNDEYAKESVADFALWKAYSPEDGEVKWDSPWGPGRPGWHIECSAMSMRYLGPTFDIHTGGSDNMFPHHEDEIAQSEAANDCQFVRYWLHCAHLIVEGKKMSKSLGNFFTLRELLEKGYDGRILRWVLLSTHYRQPLNFTFKGCDDARAALRRLDDLVRRLRQSAGNDDTQNERLPEMLEHYKHEFLAGLEDDLNISRALAGLFGLTKDLNKEFNHKAVGGKDADNALQCLREMDLVLGVLDVDQQQIEEEIPEDVARRLAERQEARKNKDFAKADAIRDELAAEGWIIEDSPAGPQARRTQ